MSCHICDGEKREEKISYEMHGITFHNFPVRQCVKCKKWTAGIGRFSYYPTYAKHLELSEFDCDSVDWKWLCEWIRNNKM